MKSSTAKSTNLLKKYIKEKFNMNVKVRSEFYTGGSSINIRYNLGLATSNIDNDLSRLEKGKFNSYEDIYEYKDDAETGIRIEGVDITEYKYVFVDRDISKEFKLKIAKAFFTRFQFAGVEVPETEEDINKSDYIDILGHWTISQYMHQHIYKMNFLTNDETQITEVYFKEDAKINDYEGIEMFYILNGQTYSTKQIEISKPQVKKELTINLNNVRMIDYSEKAIAVVGNTYEIKEELKELGGRFNKFLTVDSQKVPGWIFSKNQIDEVSNLLLKYSEQ